MGTYRLLLLCSSLAALCGFGQANTVGTEFITTFMQNGLPGLTQQRYEVRLTSHHDNTTVNIVVLGGAFSQNLSLSAGRTISVQLPASVETRGSTRFHNAVYIKSNRPINIQSLNHRLRSAETSIVYPLSSLGTMYYLVTPKQGSPNAPKVCSVIASAHDTAVRILLKGKVEFDGVVYQPNSVFTVKLAALEGVQLLSADDLSGSQVKSEKAVAVLCGHTCAPGKNNRCSHVYEQILSSEHWGRTFLVVPFSFQPVLDIVIVVASGNTKLSYVLGDSRRTLDMVEGQAVDIAVQGLTLSIGADNPVQVTFYSRGGRASRFDYSPMLMNILDTGRYCSSYYIYGQRDINNYAVIIARNASVSDINFDTRQLGSLEWKEVPGTEYLWIEYNFGNSFTSHQVQHPTDSFGLQSVGVGLQFSYGSPGSCVKGSDAPPPSCSSTVCPWRHECIMIIGKPECTRKKFASCWASGDPHYYTFDRQHYDFMGTCTYNLVTVNEDAPKELHRFTVLTKNENRGNVRVSYVGQVTIQTSNYVIDVRRGEVGYVRINNIKSLLPVTLNNGSEEDAMRLFQSGNTFISHFAGDVMVSYDWNHVVRVELTPRFSNKVSGLCGNYNQNPGDDLQTPSKSQASDVIEFGKSWKVGNDLNCWDDCRGPCLRCPPNVAEKFKADEHCGLIAKTDDGPFSQCHSVVNFNTYMNDCVYDVCLNDGYKQISCQALKDYADACQRAGANIAEWREAAGCPFNCPENSNYRLCGRSCPPTCQDPDASSPCAAPCLELCECKPGFVLIGGKCLSKENCGCVYEGRSFAPNQAFWGDRTCTRNCVCNGRSQTVECSETSCRAGEICGVKDGLQDCYPTTYGKCRTCGGTHYFPYDGGRNELTGNCQYQFSALCDHSQGLTNFQVIIHNHRLGNMNVTYVAKVDVEAYGFKIQMIREYPDHVMVNGLLRNLPFRSNDGLLNVHMTPRSMEVTTGFGLAVLYDKSWNVMVSLPSSYGKAVGGLCGNFVKSSNNDVTSSGSSAAFCNNWKPDESCGAMTRPDCVELTEKERAQRAEAKECGILLDARGPFRECLDLASPENYFKTCTYVSCILQKRLNSLCSVLSSYTEACQAAGGTVHPWRSEKFCPLSCPPNSHYEICAAGCPATCSGLSPPSGCSSACRDGCACDNGFVRSGGECVPFSQCGCVYKDAYYKAGESMYDGESCSSRCICTDSGNMICSPSTCSPNEKCGVEKGRRGCHPVGHATCIACGDPHYESFDKRRFDFQGLCSYILSENCKTGTETNLMDYRVITQHEKFGASAAVVKEVTVELSGSILTLTRDRRGTVKVNGTDYWLPVVLESGRIRVESFGPATLIKSDFGFSATYDHGYCVSVSVPSSYMGQTCGLCGNYNRNANDDLGETADEIMAHGEKWKVPDPRASCSVGCGASDNPCPDCKGAKSEIFSNQNYCGIMSSPVFTKCHAVVSFSPYMKDCLFDLCQSNGESSILCNNVATYAAACKDAGVTGIQWRREDFCPLPCPDHSHYSECADLCTTSCASLTDTYRCSGNCMEGCACDKGYFSDGKDCKEVQECGCFGHGRYYKLNEAVLSEDCSSECSCHPVHGLTCRIAKCAEDERCQILDGIRMCVNIDPCKSKQCRLKETCKLQDDKAVCVPDFISTCFAWGDPHYGTFDGFIFDFQGTSTYTLFMSHGDSQGLEPLRVVAKNNNRGSQAVSFVSLVTIHVYDQVIVIQRGQFSKIQVNGLLMNLPLTLAGGRLTVTRSAFKAVVQTSFGVEISFDWNWHVTITASSSHYGNTFGLCGDFNTDPHDDQISPNGTKMTSIIDWAASWSVYDRDPFGFHYCPGKCPTCDETKKQQYSRDTSCGIMFKEDGPFRECSSIISPNNFFDSCLYDVCIYEGAQVMLCQALETYASVCMEKRVKIHDWRTPSNCPKTCGENSHYEACGNACPASCSDREAPARCTKPCIETCQCNDGFVISADKCVPISECGCQYDGQYYQPKQEFWSDAKCRMHCRCDPSLGMVVCQPSSCKSGTSCMVENCVLGCYPTKYSTCTISSSSRCSTFDGKTFDLMGSCVYQLTGTTSNDPSMTNFTISAQYVIRGNKAVSHAREITIGIYGQSFTMSKAFPNRVKVNGILTETPYSSVQNGDHLSKVSVQHKGMSVYFSFPFGLNVSYDMEFNAIQMTIPSTYKGAVNGLCGNNNHDPSDDFSIGKVATTSEVEFVKHWTVDEKAGCVTETPRPPKCTTTQREDYGTESHCGLISSSSGPFSLCHGTVNPKQYFDSCVSAACRCSGFRPLFCGTIVSYVSACQSKGIRIKEWRSPLICPMTCLNNSHYELCGNGCPSTCDGLAPPPDCVPSCTEGCYCNNGFVLSGGDCVPIAQCGCSYNGAYYKAGQEFYTGTQCQERCTCGQNNAVRCQKHNCGPHEECAVADGHLGCQPKYTRQCTVWGGQHFNTLDGHKFNIHGTCHYVVMKYISDKFQFLVTIDNDPHGRRSASGPKSVNIHINDLHIHMDCGAAWALRINDEAYNLPYRSPDGQVLVNREGNNVMFVLPLKLHIIVGNTGDVSLRVPSSFAGSTEGLCGNYNGDPTDDFHLPDGTRVSDPVMLGAFWAVAGSERDCTGCKDGMCPQCSPPEEEQAKSREKCGLIGDPQGPFKDCHALVPPDTYVQSCVSDMCSGSEGGQALCVNVEVYQAQCQEAGATITGNWRDITDCPLVCPGNSHYMPCTKTCDYTCSGIVTETLGGSKCYEGCECDADHVLNGDRCVPMGQCGCVYNGRYLMAGESLVSLDCSQRCACHAGSVSCTPSSCTKKERCQLRDGLRGCYPRESKCTISPEKHFVTFDGASGTYPSEGAFILASSCNRNMDRHFMVVVETRACRGGSQSKKALHVFTSIGLITATGAGEIWLNGWELQEPVSLPAGPVQVLVSASNVTIEVVDFITVVLHADGEVTLTAKENLSRETCGACGNFNGDQRDDLQLQSGEPASSVTYAVYSWRARYFSTCPV